MTRAYVVEHVGSESTFYLGQNGSLSSLPKFWRSVAALKSKLKWYLNTTQPEKTTVLVISDLQKGLKNSSVQRLSLNQFMEYQPGGSRIIGDLKGATYRLGRVESDGSTAFAKGGKVWDRAGHLRSHLFYNTGRLRRYLNEGYIVFEVVYEKDGITPHTINRVRLDDFICRSPRCAKNYREFSRGSISMYVPSGAVTAAEKVL